jgi:hypothetical protein
MFILRILLILSDFLSSRMAGRDSFANALQYIFINCRTVII